MENYWVFKFVSHTDLINYGPERKLWVGELIISLCNMSVWLEQNPVLPKMASISGPYGRQRSPVVAVVSHYTKGHEMLMQLSYTCDWRLALLNNALVECDVPQPYPCVGSCVRQDDCYWKHQMLCFETTGFTLVSWLRNNVPVYADLQLPTRPISFETCPHDRNHN